MNPRTPKKTSFSPEEFKELKARFNIPENLTVIQNQITVGPKNTYRKVEDTLKSQLSKTSDKEEEKDEIEMPLNCLTPLGKESTWVSKESIEALNARFLPKTNTQKNPLNSNPALSQKKRPLETQEYDLMNLLETHPVHLLITENNVPAIANIINASKSKNDIGYDTFMEILRGNVRDVMKIMEKINNIDLLRHTHYIGIKDLRDEKGLEVKNILAQHFFNKLLGFQQLQEKFSNLTFNKLVCQTEWSKFCAILSSDIQFISDKNLQALVKIPYAEVLYALNQYSPEEEENPISEIFFKSTLNQDLAIIGSYLQFIVNPKLIEKIYFFAKNHRIANSKINLLSNRYFQLVKPELFALFRNSLFDVDTPNESLTKKISGTPNSKRHKSYDPQPWFYKEDIKIRNSSATFYKTPENLEKNFAENNFVDWSTLLSNTSREKEKPETEASKEEPHKIEAGAQADFEFDPDFLDRFDGSEFATENFRF